MKIGGTQNEGVKPDLTLPSEKSIYMAGQISNYKAQESPFPVGKPSSTLLDPEPFLILGAEYMPSFCPTDSRIISR